MEMTIAEYDEAYALLVELGERYRELPLSAHLTLMEAFDHFTQVGIAAPHSLPVVAPGTPLQIMRRAHEVLARLAECLPDAADALLVARARALLGEAMSDTR
jgi:hypothetical protein